MSGRVVLVTNNPRYLSNVTSIDLVNGSSWDVLVKVRDMVHGGCKLLSHPLYGNLRPYQQPFRSAILSLKSDNGSSSVDEYSLTLIEHALSVYRSCLDRLLLRGVLPPATEEDYAFMDMELMKQTLLQYDIFSEKGV